MADAGCQARSIRRRPGLPERHRRGLAPRGRVVPGGHPVTTRARTTSAVTMDESGAIAVMERPIADAGVLVGFEATLIGDRDLAMVGSGAANAPIVLGCSLVGRVLETDAQSQAGGLEVGGRVLA